MLVAGRYFIPESEFEWQFVRSPGPGGQNVNKVSTTARLLFRLAETFRFPPEVREKLCGKLRPRLSEEGVLAVTVRDTRSQLRNREEALRRMQAILEEALREPKRCRPTRPTAASVRRRLESKALHSLRKQERSQKRFPEE